MKRILISSTALAAVLGGVLLLVPGPAQASSAKAKFGSMRAVLRKLAQDGELTVAATVQAGSAPTFRVLLDGQPLPPDVPVHVSSVDAGDAVDYTVTIDLSDAAYKSINFGKDQNTLELIPKANPDHRDEVRIDPKTNALLGWSTLGLKDGKWQEMSNVTYSSYSVPLSGSATSKTSVVTHDEPTGAPKLYGDAPQSQPGDSSKLFDGLITIKMRVANSGGSATISVKQN